MAAGRRQILPTVAVFADVAAKSSSVAIKSEYKTSFWEENALQTGLRREGWRMGYTALYRKYRPDNFADVKGQDHIVTTLRNQILADRIGHAYLFCGTRGTGKTSVAKIFARAVNCEHPSDGSPCNECSSCRAIQSGISLNVIEIDAASNNGVDNIREIREEVAYPPSEGRYKVYIIDEVHMLSQGAFNALLKTLEEPPAYVIFILATTEAHKIPVTILSRCQRYDFRRIQTGEIEERLRELLEKEGVEADEKAIRYLARKADGGMRDALSLTDQCISFYLGQALTYERVLDMLGAVDTVIFSELLRLIVRADVAAVLMKLNALLEEGRDILQLVSDLIGYLRNLLLLKSSDAMEEMLDISPENLARMQEEMGIVRNDTLMRYIRALSDLESGMRYAVNKRVLLEITLIRLCRPEMDTDDLSLLERIRKLEKALENGARMLPPGAASFNPAYIQNPGDGRSPSDSGIRAGEVTENELPVYQKAATEDLQQVKTVWSSIVAAIKPKEPRVAAILAVARLKFDQSGREGNILYVVFPDCNGERCVNDPQCKELLENHIAEKIGKAVDVRLLLEEDEPSVRARLAEITADENLRQHIHMDIETVDDDEEDEE